ncbi:MAG: thiamine-phosphate diphosphorylase [Elusimicrobia bacterium RIFOXYA2_FULL_40_6]|nr:MAG: thiamine-phosphate diphosphorylase [Elusimicrobia bacterium RIFOXYA2_FULL_40_6]
MKGYYFITDSVLSRAGNISDVKNAVAAGVKVVQYRNKSASTLVLYKEALTLRKICKNITFIINDRLDIALASDADGVHIGQDDMPYKVARKMLGDKKIIGVTVHNLKEALKAQKHGADYLGFSPVFSTKTKLDAGRPAGPKLLSEIKKKVSIPVVAIGGINLLNVQDVISAGADGLCAISAVVCSNDVKSQIKKFQKLFLSSL